LARIALLDNPYGWIIGNVARAKKSTPHEDGMLLGTMYAMGV